MKITLGQQYTWKPTTDNFTVRAVRELTIEEKDDEVGPMYEVVAHAYADELSVLETSVTGLLWELGQILYPYGGSPDDQWNGGDVCDALAMLLDKYAPEIRDNFMKAGE